MMTPFTQAIIPSKDDRTKASYLASLSEAFESRILQGAGDAHWRIPYGIFSSLFSKPRIDDEFSTAPESEFFDFYQFVNPINDDIWPPEGGVNEAAGINVQTNILNKFIFGMNYKEREASGAWIYEREDVRANKLQENMKSNNANGFTFPYFTQIGSTSAGGESYTAMGFANEVYSLGYLNSKNSRSGNYYGGYYGSLLGSLVDPSGCGKEENGTIYPSTKVSFYKNKEVKTSNDDDTVSIKPKSYFICPQGGPNASSFNSVSSFSGYNIVYNNTGLLGRFANSQWHLDQSRTNIYLSREVDNHLLRVLYFYITHATGFDFDWFFNNQYAYAPELGSLNGFTLIYESYGVTVREVKDIALSNVRLNFTGSNLTSSQLDGTGFLPLPSNGGTPINYKNINNSVSIKETMYPNLYPEEILPVDASYAAELLFNLGITLKKDPFVLYEYNEVNKLLRVPPGFVFQRFKISKSSTDNSVTVKSFDLEIKITNNNNSYEHSLFYSISSGEDERVVLNDGRILNNDYNFEDGKSGADNYVSFKISNVQIKDGATDEQKASLSITIIPIFLLEYKPKIEDAYALIRGCCYYGTDDAKFDSPNHPFNRIIDAKYFCSYLSDDLKKYGYIKSENISNPDSTHSNSDIEINTNGVFEAARRASLCVRIVRGDNLLSYLARDNSEKASITFNAYALESGASRKSSASKSGTTTVSSAVLIEKEKYVNSGNFKNNFDGYTLSTEIWSPYPYSKYYRIDKTLQSNLSVGELDEIKPATDINEAKKNDTSIALKSFIFTALYDCVYITEKGKAYYLQFEDKNGKRYDNVKIYDLKNDNTMSEEGYDPDVGYVIGSDADQISQLWAFSREPNYGSLSSYQIATSGYFYVTDKGDFIYKEDNSLYNINFQSSVPIEKPGQTYTTYPEYITGYNPKSNTKFDLKSKFYELYNYLYLDYRAANIYDISGANSSEKILAYKTDGSFEELTESDFDKNKYDKYLRGYSIKVYTDDFNKINDATGRKLAAPKINFYYKNLAGEDAKFSITINSEEVMTLTYFNYNNNFDFDISDPDNLLTQDNPITIQIINKVDFSDAAFSLTPINRDPQIFRSAVFNVIQENLPESRYIFQGIAGEEDDSNKNGIISEANSGNRFTNEWAMWINFLPYKDSTSSPFKPDAYARVMSPFIDRCHVNSAPLIRSVENSHINLRLPRSFVPVSPPSYRYMPLKIKPAGLNFENITGEIIGEKEDVNKNDFYKSCAANIIPYKIESAIFNNGSKSVTIKLDRKLDGAAVTSYRTDANGLFEWMNSGSRSFKTGDASLSNENGYNKFVSGSGQANGYTGAFYPIFIFVKLIPKPVLDRNDFYEDTDSRLTIEPLKQAEWYLDIMREGFTDGSDNISNLCSYSGYQTSPDYTYSSLLYKSNNNNVVTLSNYDLRNSGDNIGGLASHNPRGFGAINYNGSYRDHYASIARGINSLTNFRVPYPADFTITYKTTGYEDIDTITYSNGECGIISNPWPSVALAPTSASYDLRKTDGSLMGAIASWEQSYNTDLNILQRYEISFKLVITPPKNLIKNAYDNIPLPSNPSPITANKQSSKVISDLTDVEKEKTINDKIECGGSTKYSSYKIEPITNCVNVPGNLYIDPPIYDGGSSTRFYLEINGGYIKSEVSSSYNYEFFESGFAICSPGTQPYSGKS